MRRLTGFKSSITTRTMGSSQITCFERRCVTVSDSHQSLTICGVNAHYQNGMAEKRIHDLQNLARTMLIHGNRRWPKAIGANLWPYALRTANDVMNSTPRLKHSQALLAVFASSQVTMNPKHHYHFGCPVYVLDRHMQGGGKADKWSKRSKVGIFLGQSPQHARTVALVLDLNTGLISPQFHVKMDPTFQTMRTSFEDQPIKSMWMEKCGFLEDLEIKGFESKTKIKRPLLR
jgi:hypothetical protein